MSPEELLDKIDTVMETLSFCLKNDCPHCIYRDCKNDIFNCEYQKNIASYELVKLFKEYLLNYEKYRNNI